MARKIRTQPTQVTRTPQTDTVFAQLMITTMRIYGDLAVSRGKAGGTR